MIYFHRSPRSSTITFQVLVLAGISSGQLIIITCRSLQWGAPSEVPASHRHVSRLRWRLQGENLRTESDYVHHDQYQFTRIAKLSKAMQLGNIIYDFLRHSAPQPFAATKQKQKQQQDHNFGKGNFQRQRPVAMSTPSNLVCAQMGKV